MLMGFEGLMVATENMVDGYAWRHIGTEDVDITLTVMEREGAFELQRFRTGYDTRYQNFITVSMGMET